MRVLACVKRVPAPGAGIVITEDASRIDTTNLGFTTSPHEECAVEAALQLVEIHGGDVTVVTVGPPEADEQLRYAISVGVRCAVLISNDDLAAGRDADPIATASALAQGIRDLEAIDGTFDLVLFGNESADAGGFQVGIRTARLLDRPIVNGVKGIEIDDGFATVRRECADGYEFYRLQLPAMLGVKEGINLPRYATLPGRLASKKAEVIRYDIATASGALTTLRLATPDEQLVNTVVLGDGASAAAAVVDLLAEIGLV